MITRITVGFRTLQHIVFPTIVSCYARMHPMGEVPDPASVSGSNLGKDNVDEQIDHAKRIQKIVDYNFHVVQEAFIYREKLPKLVDPNPPLKKKKGKDGDDKKRRSSQLVAPSRLEGQSGPSKAIVVKPKKSQSIKVTPMLDNV